METPSFVEKLMNKTIMCENRVLNICLRTHDVNTKGYLYLMDYNIHCYVSNLFYVNDNLFKFDIRHGNDKKTHYSLIVKSDNTLEVKSREA